MLAHKTNYFQFYSVCNWLIVVSPLAKGELLDQNYTSLITWPPKAHYMSKRTEVPPVVESYIYQLNAKDFQKVIATRKCYITRYGPYALMAAGGTLLGHELKS